MLVSLKDVLSRAERGNYAVPQFNINNMEIIQGVMAAAEKMRSPVILATSETAIQYAGLDYLKAMIQVAAKSPISIVLHLDHGTNLDIIRQTIEAGWTSVMFDGSSLPFEENVKTTWRIVQWAHTKNISVEAELGALRGIEDLISVSAKEATFTNPEQARDFVKKTECDALAVAIGTSHGAYKFAGKTHLDLKRLKEIDKMVGVPLVLHGASGVPAWLKKRAVRAGVKIKKAQGIPDILIKKAIKLGVRKINIDTDLRLAFTTGLREVIKNQPEVFDPRKILGPARDLIYQVACEKIRLFGSARKG